MHTKEFQIGISELSLASFPKQVLVPFLSFENAILFTCKLNSLSKDGGLSLMERLNLRQL